MSGNCVDKNTPNIFQDPITREDVDIIIQRALGPSVKVLNYHVKSYSEATIGFMGLHKNLNITCQREGSLEKELHSFFLKTIPRDSVGQAAVIEETNVFYKEINFYKILVPEFAKATPDLSWTAQCYLVKDYVMVLEDLRLRNFTMREKILDLKHLRVTVGTLAKLHVSSILTEKRLGKSLLELYPEVLEEQLFVQKGRMYEWFRYGVKAAVDLAKYLGFDSTCVSKVCNRIFEATSPSKSYQNVVCHGDPWSFNVMFNQSQPPRAVLLDFQHIRYTSPMVDIAQCLYLTTRKDFREKHEEELLRHYHEVFCETLRENNKQIDLPEFSDVLQEYERTRIAGIATAVIYFPINLLDGKLVAEKIQGYDGWANLMLNDRSDFALERMKVDPDYNARITENIKELVDRSKMLLA